MNRAGSLGGGPNCSADSALFFSPGRIRTRNALTVPRGHMAADLSHVRWVSQFGTSTSSPWRPDDEFETDKPNFGIEVAQIRVAKSVALKVFEDDPVRAGYTLPRCPSHRTTPSPRRRKSATVIISIPPKLPSDRRSSSRVMIASEPAATAHSTIRIFIRITRNDLDFLRRRDVPADAAHVALGLRQLFW